MYFILLIKIKRYVYLLKKLIQLNVLFFQGLIIFAFSRFKLVFIAEDEREIYLN